MTNSSSRIQVLERLLGLEKKRAEAQAAVEKATAALNQLNAEIASLESGALLAAPAAAAARTSAKLFPAAAKPAPGAAKPAPGAAKPAVAPKPAAAPKGRGHLKQSVLDLLTKAGPKGMSVAEIAAATHSKPINIFAWFNSTGRKVSGLKKIRRGVYALSGPIVEGPVPTVPKPAPASKPAPAPAAKPAVKPEAKPAAKAPAAPAPGKRRPRGSLTEGILKHLKSAGPKGIALKVIAADLKTNPRNVSIWLATTGKQFKGITKLSKGVYTMKA